ncbi:MAG: 2OG-Fe(II) oxygenase [Rubrivivax sp.]|nr:2OG-Fe(II) oxygenase [Rubrivivax sp.]
MSQTRSSPAQQAGQQATPQLQHWIAEHLRVGTPPAEIIEGMVLAGWSTATAAQALADAVAGRDAVQRASSIAPAGALPEPEIADGRNVLVIDGHPVRLGLALKHPRVVVFEGFLSAEECAGLVEQSRPRLLRSETVHNASGGSEVNAARTSDGMFFTRGETPLIARIEARIAALLRWPASHGEGLQILRYRPGAEYQPHYDYFDPVHSGTPTILQRGGQRVGTLVIYLVAPERGGATTFPAVGLEVAPVAGNAVFFSYDRPHPSTGTLHGGAPVLEGEKWVATKWLREGEFH